MTIITNEGKKLITHAILNKLDLFISKVVYADCNLDTLDENTTTFTNIKYENLPTSVRIDEFDNSKIILEAVLKNDTAQDFFINCVGFIAKNGELLCFTKIKRTSVLSKATDTNTSLLHYKLAIELTNANDLSIKIDETIVYPTLAHFNASQKAQDEKIKTLEISKADKSSLDDYYLNQKGEELNKRLIKAEGYCNDLSTKKANKTEVFTKDEINTKLNAKANIGDLTKAKSDLEVRIKAVENDYVKVYDTPINVSVGAGGTYAKLSDAFKALMCYKKARANVGDCVITLLPNFVLNEQLTFDNVDLAHIRITSNNAVIKCEFAHEASANFVVFRFFHSKSCLFFRCKFDFTNKPQRLIQISHNGSLRFCECSVNNSTYGIISYNGFADVRSCTFTNTIETCLYFSENANLNAISNTYDTSNRAIVSLRNTKLNSYREIFKNIKLECFLVDWGGFAMYEAHPNGSFVNSPKKCNLEPNTLYKHGIFFDRTTPEEPIIQTNIPNGKMFKCNGINVIILRNLKVVPIVTANSTTSGLKGSVTLTYTITLPVGGVFLVGMNYKGVFMSGQKIEDTKSLNNWKDIGNYLNKGTGFQVPTEERTYNIVAIGY